MYQVKEQLYVEVIIDVDVKNKSGIGKRIKQELQ
jgi:hypothetical protein